MDIDTFRQAFPEFADEASYPDPMLEFWSSLGDKLFNVTRWGTLLDQGIQLYVAHNITLASVDLGAADIGRVPGASGVLIASKGVDGVSVSYNTQAFTLDGAGNYNMTKYGREFWQLMLIVGTGGIQIT